MKVPLRLRSIVLVASLAAGAAVASAGSADAQAWLPEKGDGWISIWYQRLWVTQHLDFQGHASDRGRIYGRTAIVDLGYAIANRWTLTATLPYVTSHYEGSLPEAPADSRSGYHGSWQDWGLGVHYLALRDPLVVTPFVSFGIPSHAYGTLGHTAIGTDLRQVSAGAALGKLGWPFADEYVQGAGSYSYVEKVSGFDRTNHFNLALGVGYIATPNLDLVASAAYQKSQGGILLTDTLSDENVLLNHDRVARVNYLRLGLEASYAVNRTLQVFAGVDGIVWGQNTHNGRSYSVGFTHGFSRRQGISTD